METGGGTTGGEEEEREERFERRAVSATAEDAEGSRDSLSLSFIVWRIPENELFRFLEPPDGGDSGGGGGG